MLAMSTAQMPNNALSATTNGSVFADEAVFRKTVAGHREFELRQMPLRAELRRLLILIDGKRGIRSLAQCFRAGDLLLLLDELRIYGLIDEVESSGSFTEITVRDALNDANSMSQNQFDEVRGCAIHAAVELLGAAAQPSRLALTLCRDQRGLREILAELEGQLIAMLGHDAATLFFATVRDASSRAAAMMNMPSAVAS